ncbi:SIR2 family protein [Pantoea sp. Mb-10]|uniref:SIR2 family protein n=1 Tax=unclassified Pantoea TaxID=2630326 RepID=UPI001E44551E|nr:MULTISPECIES: SIR2 family protein [unclassified Pantoea]MCE0490927.1 SIR2 family protein [Pantoea sp. Mb-10]MCE0499915.1 SIR2 family protein [Pantoea sp. Pb-8]
MSEIFEIAYAAATNRLCLFTGTGFSKAVSGGTAPTWQGLLEKLCDAIPNSAKFKASLFPKDKPSALSLEEAAQIISLKLAAEDKDIYNEVADIIKAITLSGENKNISAFFQNRPFRIVTTNYDKLAETLTAENSVQSITPGLPIPRSSANIKVYHVHGSIDSPKNMVITSDDYFKFLNADSYFSRKLSTVLHENTVVILGYSLGDTNLKAIINDYKGFSKSHVVGSNIFLVSRSVVDQNVKDYYSHCYGIRVLDSLELESFFDKLNAAIPKAEEVSVESLKSIRQVVYENYAFTDDYLKLEDSFYQIISAISAEGLSWNNQAVVKVIGDIIERKTDFTRENNAWVQYEHLARWLIYLGAIFELKGTTIEDKYLDAVIRSMATMSKDYSFGYSWNAYKSWQERWSSITVSNRILIRKHIKVNNPRQDALTIVDGIE